MAADGGSDGNGNPVKPPQHHRHQGTASVTPPKASMKSKSRERSQSESPESTLTCTAAAAAAASNLGDGDGNGVEEVQQQTNGKKPRVVWTPELHDKFVRACKFLGKDAVPKKILAVMKVNGLTRENVASHLQKYRQSLQGKGQSVRRRGGSNGGATTVTRHHSAPDRQPAALPQAQPIDQAAFPHQAPSASPSVDPPQQAGSFAAANTPHHPQTGHGQMVQQALPASGHQQQHQDFNTTQAALFYPAPPHVQAAIDPGKRMAIERHAQHAAWMKRQQAGGHDHHHAAPVNYELLAQTTLPCRAPAAATGVQSHGLQMHVQAGHHQAVNTNGGLYSVPEASTRDEQRETRMAMPQLQIPVQSEAGLQVPAAEPGLASSAASSDGEGSSGAMHLWHDDGDHQPSMDHMFPPVKPI